VTQLFQTERSDKLTFHILDHTLEALSTAKQIGEISKLPKREIRVFFLSTLSHDEGNIYNQKCMKK